MGTNLVILRVFQLGIVIFLWHKWWSPNVTKPVSMPPLAKHLAWTVHPQVISSIASHSSPWLDACICEVASSNPNWNRVFELIKETAEIDDIVSLLPFAKLAAIIFNLPLSAAKISLPNYEGEYVSLSKWHPVSNLIDLQAETLGVWLGLMALPFNHWM